LVTTATGTYIYISSTIGRDMVNSNQGDRGEYICATSGANTATQRHRKVLDCAAQYTVKNCTVNCTVKYTGILNSFSLLYSTLLHLPPLRFHCVGGC
jgi:hypothetical protein